MNRNETLPGFYVALVLMMCFLVGRSFSAISSPQPGSASEDQKRAYRSCVESAESVENHAQAIVPPRRWNFDSQRYSLYFGELRREADKLVANQAVFESTLAAEQKSKLDSIHMLAQLRRQLESHLQSIDRELESVIRGNHSSR